MNETGDCAKHGEGVVFRSKGCKGGSRCTQCYQDARIKFKLSNAVKKTKYCKMCKQIQPIYASTGSCKICVKAKVTKRRDVDKAVHRQPPAVRRRHNDVDEEWFEKTKSVPESARTGQNLLDLLLNVSANEAKIREATLEMAHNVIADADSRRLFDADDDNDNEACVHYALELADTRNMIYDSLVAGTWPLSKRQVTASPLITKETLFARYVPQILATTDAGIRGDLLRNYFPDAYTYLSHNVERFIEKRHALLEPAIARYRAKEAKRLATGFDLLGDEDDVIDLDEYQTGLQTAAIRLLRGEFACKW